ncbi:hypothetical protein Q8F55_000688 [Vanrija albida]|uniref:Uncharacterized protein n=1 Tax=Vanrija albida TaxID=181172 RepID=A0ABR3QDZ7_9TREE
MAIFKKKASKEREHGARSPTNSPPVQAPPMMQAMAAAGQDAAAAFNPANPNPNPRRLTNQQMPYPAPQGILVDGSSGRNSPGPAYNFGVGHPSTTSLGGSHLPGAAPPFNGPSPLATSSVLVGPNGPTGPPSQSSQSSSNLPPGAASGPGYPWSTRTLRLYQPPPTAPASTPTSPFPRYGLSVPSYPSHSGHMLLFGGLAHDRAHNDLWSLDVRDCSLQLVKTRGDAPLARIGHVSAIADRVMLVFGGDTKLTETDKQDDGLYLLDLRTQEWTRVPVLAGPSGRYGHAACMIGNTFYVHGGHVDCRNLDDLWAFDVSQLGKDGVQRYQWERVSYSSPAPLARTGHTLVPLRNKLYLFGGTDGDYHYNDSWSFDITTGAWSELECIGYIPIPREGHAAAIVDDVIYVFGGRDVHGKDLGDLAAFRISNQRWYMFQNMGPSPMAKSGHSLCAAHGKVFVVGGESNLAPTPTNVRDDPNLVHVLDTTKIKYPADNPSARGSTPATAITRPRTTSDVGGRPGTAPGPYGGPSQLSGGPGGASMAQFSRSYDNLSRSISPSVIASEPRPLIIANETGSVQSRHTPRSESQDSGPPRPNPNPNPNGVPPQRPRREGDEEFRRAMSPPVIITSANGTAVSSPATDRVVTPNGISSPTSPQAHVTSHTIHPNVRNTRSPPPQLRNGEGLDRPALPPDAFYFGGRSPNSGSRPNSINAGRPASFLGRPGSIVGNRPNSIAGTADLLRELKARETEADGAKRREAAMRVVLSRAVQQGFVAEEEAVDVPTGDIVADNETVRQLVDALVQMKQDKANLQNDVATQMRVASDKIQDAERLQKSALQEAAYYRAKAAALETGSTVDLSRVEADRIADLERQLEASANEQTASHLELERAKTDLAHLREVNSTAEEREAETLQRAEQAEEAHAQLLEELEDLRQQSATQDKQSRDLTERFITATSNLQQRESERNQFRSQLDDITGKHDEHLQLIEAAQASLVAAGVRSAELEELHASSREQIVQLEKELAEARHELEAKTKEADDARQRAVEVEGLHTKSIEEVTSLRAVTAGRLGELLESSRSVNGDNERSIKGHQDQLRALEEEKSSLLKLLREAGQRVDATELAASTHQQKAREIETTHKALRGEMRQHRTKLLATQKEIAKYRDLYAAKDAELRERDQAVTELQTRVSLLRKHLGEQGVNVSDADLDSLETPSSRELETQLRDKSRAHESAQREIDELTRRCQEAEDKVESLGRLVERVKDTRSPSAASMRSPTPPSDSDRRAIEAERRLHEVEAQHKEKMAALEGDYQTAVRYVKGTEKMLKRMKDELNKQKTTNSQLIAELDGYRGRAGSTEPGARGISGRSTPSVSEGELHRRLNTLQSQYVSLQQELQASQDVLNARQREVDLLRMRSEEAERDNEALRDEVAQCQHRIDTLLEMNQSGIHLGSDDGGERIGLRRHSSASTDGVTSTVFDKFTNELKQWERARSPDAHTDVELPMFHNDDHVLEHTGAHAGANGTAHKTAPLTINHSTSPKSNNPFTGAAVQAAAALNDVGNHQRNSSSYSGDWLN